MTSEPADDRRVAAADSVDREGMREALSAFLRSAGLEEAASGEAAAKAASAWTEDLLVGYRRDPLEILRPTWPDRAGQMVTVRGIPFVSVCAHHLLPFFGKAHVAYLPEAELTGLSRIEEMVHCLSRRLQLQERLGEEIAGTLMEAVAARGAACVLEAEHLCVFARGQRHRGTVTQTFCFRGELESDRALQERCLGWLRTGDGQ